MTLAPPPWPAWLAHAPAPFAHGAYRAFGALADEIACLTTEATKAPCPDLASIEIRGPDALDFLHGQFSGDIRALTTGASVLTAWCSAKGRVLFLVRVLRSADALHVLLPRAAAAAFVKRLRLYVLRAAVEIVDCSDSRGVLVINSPHALALPAVAAPLCLGSSADQRQHWLLGDFDPLAAAWQAMTTTAVGTAAAAVADIRRGLPALAPALTDEFLPQELNLDVLDGVSFNKGCYPGQEIVARVKFRGAVKRRLQRFRGTGDAAPAAGERVLSGTGNPVGTVLVSAPTASATFELLAVVDIDAQSTTPLLLATGALALTPAELPYAAVC